MTEGQNQFGRLMRQAREAAGLTRDELAARVKLDASHLYRIEKGDRRPGRDATLALADALKIEGDDLNEWLMAAGYAPMPLLTMVRGTVRTRGASRRPGTKTAMTRGWDGARWIEQLEAMGFQETAIRRLLQAMEDAETEERKEVANSIATSISRVTERLAASVRTAVIPAAGGYHQIIAPHIMLRLLLGAISEATESGISKVILVLAPGSVESLYVPLKEALELSVVPSIKLHYCLQAKPEGLGDAILHAEELVGQEPFAVLLPDDIVRERTERTAYPQELRRMMDSFDQLEESYVAAITSVPKTKMPKYGVAKIGSKEVIPDILPVMQLIEKPESSNPIVESARSFGIVGRYLLQPGIFSPLREIKEKGLRPVQLTTALESLRRAGQNIYAFELKATREDIGEVFGQASDLMANSSDSSSLSR